MNIFVRYIIAFVFLILGGVFLFYFKYKTFEYLGMTFLALSILIMDYKQYE